MANPEDPRDAPRDGSSLQLVAGVAALVSVAVVVRFVTSSPLWLDEALSTNIASLPVGDIAGALEHDGHPPLFYLLLHGWMRVFGDGDSAVRAFSGLLGVAALPLGWLAGRRVGGPRVAAATVLVLAVSPFAVRFSTEARMYALVMVLVFAGHLLVRRATDEREAGLGLLAGVAAITALLLWTHYWSAYLAAGVVAVLGWWGRRSGSPERAVAVRLVAAVAVGGVCFVPWLPSLLDQAAHTGTPWAGPARPGTVIDETLRSFGGGDFAEAGLLGVALVVLFLVGLTASSDHRATHLVLGRPPRGTVAGETATIVLTVGLGTLAGVLGSTTYAPRYSAVVFPLVAIVVGRGLAVLPGLVAPAVAVAAIVLFGVAGIAANILDDRTQAEAIAEGVAAAAGPDDVVAVCPDQLGPAVRRALDAEGLADVPVLAYPTLDDGRFVDWYEYEARNDAADPAAVAAEVLDRVPAGGSVWVASNGAYRTFEGDCEAFLNGLTAARGPAALVVAEDDEFFEHAGLVVFAPP